MSAPKKAETKRSDIALGRVPIEHLTPTGTDNVRPLPIDEDQSFRFQPETWDERGQRIQSAKPPAWIVDGVMSNEDYALIAGDAKAGKSWLAGDLAISVASGAKFLDAYQTQQGRVVVFNGEGAERILTRRFEAIARERCETIKAAADNLFIFDGVPKFGDDRALEDARQALRRIDPLLVIVDPLYFALAGIPSSQLSDVGYVLTSFREVVESAGGQLLLIDHWNKNGAGTGTDRATGAGKKEWPRLLGSLSVEEIHPSRIDAQRTHSDLTVKLAFSGGNIGGGEAVTYRRTIESTRFDLVGDIKYSTTVISASEVAQRVTDRQDQKQLDQLQDMQKRLAKEARKGKARSLTKTGWVESVSGKKETKLAAFDRLVDSGLFVPSNTDATGLPASRSAFTVDPNHALIGDKK